MEKTYRSKVDFWLLAVIYAVIIASVVPIGCSGNVAVSIIIAAVLIVPITFYLFNIRYVIRGTSLIVKDGLFSHAYGHKRHSIHQAYPHVAFGASGITRQARDKLHPRLARCIAKAQG